MTCEAKLLYRNITSETIMHKKYKIYSVINFCKVAFQRF